MIDAIERAALARWSGLGLPGPRPRRIAFTLDGRDAQRHGRVRFTAFRDEEIAPLFRGKIPRDGAAQRAVLAEHSLLRALAEEVPGAAGRLFPRPLFAEERAGGAATAETSTPGRPPREGLEALAAGERWLAAFRTATGVLRGAGRAVLEPYVRATLAAAETSPAGAARRQLEAFAAELETRAGAVSCTFGHGDLRASRLSLTPDGSVCARDWEEGRPRQPAWADPVSLALDVVLRGPRPALWTEAEVLDAFRTSFLENGPFAARLRRYFHETLAGTGSAAEDLALAIPATALLAAQRAARTADGPPDPWSWRDIARAALAPAARDALRGLAADPATSAA